MNTDIFKPIYNITSSIEEALDDIERNRWLVENRLQISNYHAWIRRDVQVKRASGTTRIEGVGLEESEVRELRRTDPRGTLTENQQANINALEAYEFIDYLSNQTDLPIDELAIREMNRIFIKGASEALTPGIYRKGQNTVGRFTPPNQGDVPTLMRAFALWLRQEDENIHPILRAGIAHIHFVAIHPFWDGNGRTARGLTTLILQRSRYSFDKLLSMELHLSEIQDEYFRAIERTLGAEFTLNYDATSWLEFFTNALKNHLQFMMEVFVGLDRSIEEVYKALEPLGFSTRLANGYSYALFSGYIKRAEYVEVTGVSEATASRDLAKLSDAGWLIPEGNSRNRIYRPAPLPSDNED